ncbi:hypothetical protein NHX12_013217 [Muraenolepis orangiensis]|uniref:Uncharacterized protein n=1 Tax=Muraenolepis orangiensis TaxID=630683 RepID=A0A9Q0I676_9TELE|nr:hypothetical protein NHX12_013217 [Muraenolepis orangiensis]
MRVGGRAAQEVESTMRVGGRAAQEVESTMRVGRQYGSGGRVHHESREAVRLRRGLWRPDNAPSRAKRAHRCGSTSAGPRGPRVATRCNNRDSGPQPPRCDTGQEPCAMETS